MISQAGNIRRITANRTVLVYRRKDGQVVQRHDHTSFEGAAAASDDYVEKRALEHATRRGHAAADLAALHVTPESLKHGTHYAVDLKMKRLVELAPPRR